MQVVRCPECGNRLSSGYCPMCMKRVPILAQKKETPWQQRKYNRPGTDEDHTCISFDELPTKSRQNPIFTIGSERKQKKKLGKKPAAIAAVVVAVLSLLPTIADIFDTISTGIAEPEPDIDYSAYIEAGQPGAENVPAIEATEIYREGAITVTVDSAGLYYDNYAIAVTVVNDSNQNVNLSSELLCVNDYMLPTSGLFMQVEKGETCQDYLLLYADDLEEAGIEQVAMVSFGLDIYDSDDYTEVGYMYPSLLMTDAIGTYVQKVDDSGWELYSQNGVRIVLKSTELDDYGDCTFTLFMENTTEDLVNIYDQGVYVNEEETLGMLWASLMPISRTITYIYVYDVEEMDIQDLEDIQEVLIDLHIEYIDGLDLQNWQVEETVNTTITFTPAEME